MDKSIPFLLVLILVSLSLACGLASPAQTPSVPPTQAPPAAPTEAPVAAPATPTLPQPTTPPLPSAVPTALLAHPDWNTYHNVKYGFTLVYPKDGQIAQAGDANARIDLPFDPGTNLGEKYLEITVTENAQSCSSPKGQGYPPDMLQSESVTLGGLPFKKESGSDAGAGNLYEWTGYSTAKGSACISLDFVLHSSNPGMYSTPPVLFDKQRESEIFGEIAATFQWGQP